MFVAVGAFFAVWGVLVLLGVIKLDARPAKNREQGRAHQADLERPPRSHRDDAPHPRAL
jgi:hypothetical protein